MNFITLTIIVILVSFIASSAIIPFKVIELKEKNEDSAFLQDIRGLEISNNMSYSIQVSIGKETINAMFDSGADTSYAVIKDPIAQGCINLNKPKTLNFFSSSVSGNMYKCPLIIDGTTLSATIDILIIDESSNHLYGLKGLIGFMGPSSSDISGNLMKNLKSLGKPVDFIWSTTLASNSSGFFTIGQSSPLAGTPIVNEKRLPLLQDNLSLIKLQMGNQPEISFSPYAGNPGFDINKERVDVMFDTGFGYNLSGSTLWNYFMQMFEPYFKSNQCSLNFYINCSSEALSSLPNITFVFGQYSKVTLTPYQYFISDRNINYIFSFYLDSREMMKSRAIFGFPFMSKVIFEVDNRVQNNLGSIRMYKNYLLPENRFN